MSLDLKIPDQESALQEEPNKLSLEIPNTIHDQASSSVASAVSPEISSNPLTDYDLLPPSSEPSSGANTRPSSATTSTASTSSLLVGSQKPSPSTSSLNVRFAPLPEIAPRRRKSNTPLGMAARGQLVRRRRGHYDSAEGQQQIQEARKAAQQMWTREEFEERRALEEAMAARHAYYLASAAAAEAREEQEEEENNERINTRRSSADDLEDSSFSLGKLVKGAGKTLWKSVSITDVAAAANKGKTKENGKEKRRHPQRPEGVDIRRKSDPGPPLTTPTIDIPPLPAARPLLATIISNTPNAQRADDSAETHEEGGVWEEEIDDSFLKNVGQTETIIEGRAVFSVKSEVLATPPSPSPPTVGKRISPLGKP